MIKNNIDPNKWYSGKAVVDMEGVLDWKSRWTFSKKLKEKKWAKIFKPIFSKKEVMTRVSIKGQNIINYLESKKNENKNIK